MSTGNGFWPLVQGAWELSGTAWPRCRTTRRWWSGLVLLSMKLDLDAARLREAGVRRVVLAAGDRDDTRGPMEALARSLEQGGLEARFTSLVSSPGLTTSS